MKLAFKTLAIIFTSLLLFSCSNDSSEPTDDSVKDDYDFLAVTFAGKINKIGNNSGKITPYAEFEGLTSNTINLNAVTSNSDKIFLVEYYSPSTKLFVFDKKTKKTISKSIVLPNEAVGSYPSISSLIWNDSKKALYGTIISNTYISPVNNVSYFIKIDPETFEISYLGLSFDQTASTSIFLNGNKLYSSYSNQGTYEIDIDNNKAQKVLFNNAAFSFSKPSVISTNTAYCITNKTGSIGNTIAKINLSNYTYEDLLPNDQLGYAYLNGQGYIDKNSNEYVCCVQKGTEEFVLLKFNISTKAYKYFALKSNTLIDSNFIIVDQVN
ncbi:hypothetical protein HNP37_003377 [Flavobacterium nitrogenifigens]|uniref:TolB-like 6-blade propeller-like n=2 Tax=Flavobacterium TaxID=237 RepID=A0A7W7IZB5_9FLAO|nr:MULTISPECIES: hypothetical protein [Flavobacterium]MBB4803302.1 hypothetical protein [Flavobacterium nitrogenifigens]MBB6388260.1 hypothetical protein [Flavobacterium notoginsengisoli]